MTSNHETKTALALAESSEWAALHRLVTAQPERAEELDDFGMMPLHWACTDTHVPLRIVKKLVEAYPPAVMLKNKGGLIPLHIAVKAKTKLDVLQALIAANDESLFEETPTGETPAELAQAMRLPSDKIAYLAQREEELRAIGRAPPRPSGKFQSFAALVPPEPTVIHNQENIPPLNGSKTILRHANSVQNLRFPNSMAGVPLPPRWRLDKRCNICQLKFSYFKTRHHCRSCGESVCSTHSNRRLPLHYLGLKTPQRVCILCYDDLRENGKPTAVVNIYAPSAAHDRMGKKISTNSHTSSAITLPPRESDEDTVDVDGLERSALSRSSLMLNAPRKLLRSVSHEVVHGFDHNHHTNKPTSKSVVEDTRQRADEARPRAWTDLESSQQWTEMQDAERDLKAHLQDLLSTKDHVQHEIAQNNRAVQSAVQEKMKYECAVAELRDNRMIDFNRITLEDDDDDEDDKSIRDGSTDGSSDEETSSTPMVDDTAVDVAATCNYLGLAYFDKGEFSSAILEFRKSVALNRKDPNSWYNLARALHSAGEFYDAEIAIRRGMDLTEKSYAFLSLLGKILHSRGDHDQSIAVFREALGLINPDEFSDDDNDVGSMTVGW